MENSADAVFAPSCIAALSAAGIIHRTDAPVYLRFQGRDVLLNLLNDNAFPSLPSNPLHQPVCEPVPRQEWPRTRSTVLYALYNSLPLIWLLWPKTPLSEGYYPLFIIPAFEVELYLVLTIWVLALLMLRHFILSIGIYPVMWMFRLLAVKRFEKKGFHAQKFHKLNGGALLIDIEQGVIALQFILNPFRLYIIDCTALSRVDTLCDESDVFLAFTAGSTRLPIRVKTGQFNSSSVTERGQEISRKIISEDIYPILKRVAHREIKGSGLY